MSQDPPNVNSEQRDGVGVGTSEPLGIANVPTDAIVVVVATLAGLGGTLLEPGLLRSLVTLPLLLFLPGYAFSIALFPASGNPVRDDLGPGVRTPIRAGLPVGHRLAVAFGTSLAIVPVLGIALWWLLGTIEAPVVLAGLSTLILSLTTVGVVRRRNVPAGHRPGLGPSGWASDPRALLRLPRGSGEVLRLAVVVGLVLAVGSLGFAVLAPLDGSSYTSVALLTPSNESDELVAAGYPTELNLSSEDELVFAVENNEGEVEAYSVVVALQQVSGGDVVASELLSTSTGQVAPGDTWEVSHQPASLVTPDAAVGGQDVRLTYLLYRGDPPGDPTRENAYRTLYVTVDTTAITES